MRGKEKWMKMLFLILAVLVLVIIIVLIRNFRFGGEKEEVKVGGIFIGECDDGGWNESHYSGILSACEELSCPFEVREHIEEDRNSLEKAVSELRGEGCNVVFMTSYGYGGYANDIALKYPDMAFYCISGKGEAKNLASYFARMYQVRYLAGIVAGKTSKSGKLGVVASMPLSETNRAINAYAMGARLADPDTKVMVYFTGSWDDEEEERYATRFLADKGADVITYHEDKPYAIDESEKMGLYSTGYEGVYDEHSDKYLTAAIVNWDVLYKRVLGDYLSGRANFANDYWLGISEGAVSLYPYSGLVDEKTRELVENEKKRIQTWRDVFSGEIYDNEGECRCDKDERISDDELFNGMSWFVDGVEIYEKD